MGRGSSVGTGALARPGRAQLGRSSNPSTIHEYGGETVPLIFCLRFWLTVYAKNSCSREVNRLLFLRSETEDLTPKT